MTPKTEKELAEAVRDTATPLRIMGGGTRPVATGTASEALSTAALSGITLYDPGALTLVAQAGTPLPEIEAALTAENQRLAFEPMDHRGLLGTQGTPTLGGVVAANISGPRRIAVGACRDFMLGVRFVDGHGTIIKNGGRVMKNVTGYDLVKLQSGAYGTLGVLTEVSLKVLPDVETEATIVVPGRDPTTAVKAMSAALGSPFETTGAACSNGNVMIRLEGFADSVSYRTGQMQALLAPFGTVDVLSQDESRARWRDLRDVVDLQDTTGDIWRISVKPTDAPGILDRLSPTLHMLDWGGGLIWAAVPAGTDVRDALQVAGHATLVRAGAATEVPRLHPESGPLAAISAGLRAKFDPRGVLNPGVMV